MENIIPNLFTIALYPFTSQTFFVMIPVFLCFFSSLMMLVMRIMKGDFRCSVS